MDSKMNTNKSKHARHSRTIKLNGSVGFLGVALTAVAEILPEFREYMQPEVFTIAMAVLGLANVSLRKSTDTPIKD